MSARTTWYYLKEHLKREYLHSEAGDFYKYHKAIAREMIQDESNSKRVIKGLSNNELFERLTVGASRTFFDGLGISIAIDSSVNNTNGMGYCLLSILLGRVVPKAIQRYLNFEREEAIDATEHILKNQYQEKGLSNLINQGPKPPKPEKDYFENERENYGPDGSDDSGEEWKK